jgi:hypothetical protein
MRWRTTWPEDAGTGATPASIANAASDRSRPLCDQLIRTCAAVTGPTGLTLPYSSGAVEGAVNRIKMIKRKMFGRARFDLLRKLIMDG